MGLLEVPHIGLQGSSCSTVTFPSTLDVQIASNYWMARASHVSKDAEAPVSTSTLISVFVALVVASSLCIFVRAFVSCGRCIQNSNSVVQQDAHGHIQSSYVFFDYNPSGSILNRVSYLHQLKFPLKFYLLTSTMRTLKKVANDYRGYVFVSVSKKI